MPVYAGTADALQGPFSDFHNFFLCFHDWMIFSNKSQYFLYKMSYPESRQPCRPQVLRDQKSLAKLQSSHVPLLVYVFTGNCRELLPFCPFLRWAGKAKKVIQRHEQREDKTDQSGEPGNSNFLKTCCKKISHSSLHLHLLLYIFKLLF